MGVRIEAPAPMTVQTVRRAAEPPRTDGRKIFTPPIVRRRLEELQILSPVNASRSARRKVRRAANVGFNGK